MNRKRTLTAVVAGGLIAAGVAAPAFAEGFRTGHIAGWSDGHASPKWQDKNSDGTTTHVTFNDCTREFKATIRRIKTLAPDPRVGAEHINCRSYADAVYGGDLPAADYHFDLSGMGIHHCIGGACYPNLTSVNSLYVYW